MGVYTLIYQAGLAHARFSHQGDDLAMACLRLCQGLMECLQLRLPSHKGVSPRAAAAWRPLPDTTGAYQLKDLDRLLQPLSLVLVLAL